MAQPSAPQIETVTVTLGDRSYPIHIGDGILDRVGAETAMIARGGRTAAVVTNPTVGTLYLSSVSASLRRAGFTVHAINIPDGEEHKHLGSLASIYDRLVEARMDRTAPLLALGGGVIGDVAGFAAATYLRGVPFIQLPTTLLAQVDSSVGGKTGVNLTTGKNLVGAFYQPRLVLIDIGTLRTLPARELRAGLAEVIKYGAILDADLFGLVETHLEAVLALDPTVLRRIVRRCCELKAMVVARDERESDYRSILNFGHTIGHALESVAAFQGYLHGEAVAIGMCCAATLSVAHGWCAADTMQRLVALLQRAGLPTAMPADITAARLAPAIERDKKVTQGQVKFVCLEEVGRARFEHLKVDEIAAYGG